MPLRKLSVAPATTLTTVGPIHEQYELSKSEEEAVKVSVLQALAGNVERCWMLERTMNQDKVSSSIQIM